MPPKIMRQPLRPKSCEKSLEAEATQPYAAANSRCAGVLKRQIIRRGPICMRPHRAPNN